MVNPGVGRVRPGGREFFIIDFDFQVHARIPL